MALDENNQSPIDEKYKEGKGSYYNSNSLNNAEGEAAADNNQDSNRLSTANNIENNENNSTIAPSWNTNLSSMTTNLAKSKLKARTSVKKGPLAFIIIAFLALGGGATVLFLPSTLFVQIANVMETKFNRQFDSYQKEMEKIFSNKLISGANLTSGVCTNSVSILCKYSTLSKNEVKNLKDSGVEVTYNEDGLSSKLGRIKPKNLKFNNETISPKDFSTKLSSDAEFSSAIDKAFTPKYISFSDRIWKSFSNKVKIIKGKNAVNTANSDDEKTKAMQEETESGEESTKSTSDYLKEKEDSDEKLDEKTKEAIDKNSKDIDDTQSALTEATKDASGVAESTASDVLKNAEKAANIIKIDGWISIPCSVYKAIEGLAYAAKAVRAFQLIRFAMLILNEADQIKAGVAKPSDTSYYGKMLTTETMSEDGTYKSATDSFGYKYAAYGEVGTMSTSASQYLVGGGLTGKLSNIVSAINNHFAGKSAKTVCNINQNEFVQAGSLVLGVALLFVPGVNAAIGIKDVAQAVGLAIFNEATNLIPALLKDTLAGTVISKNTVGESAGDALTSGSSSLMGELANEGGNAPLTPSQAVAYTNLSDQLTEESANEDRLTHSPFDASDSNTFLGKIVFNLLPYMTKMSSLTSTINSLIGFSGDSIASIVSSKTKADNSVAAYSMCQDSTYNSLGIATDPYCNVVYGIPTEYLNENPTEVAQSLENSNDIDSQGNIISNRYKEFVNNCINRDTNSPLGSNDKNGTACLVNSSNKNYYLYYIDNRVVTNLEGESD